MQTKLYSLMEGDEYEKPRCWLDLSSITLDFVHFFKNDFLSSKDAHRTCVIKQPHEKIEIRTVLLLNCALTFSSIIFLFKIWVFSIYSSFVIAITVSAYLWHLGIIIQAKVLLLQSAANLIYSLTLF